MDLLVLRHGLAADRERWDGADADRPLTRSGKRRTRAVLRTLADHYQPQAIWTSPWLRAKQTADLAGEVWHEAPVSEHLWLAGDHSRPSEGLREMLSAGVNTLMIVGHEPDLGELIGHLLGSQPLPLRKAGLAALRGHLADGGMELRALLHPSLVLNLSGNDL